MKKSEFSEEWKRRRKRKNKDLDSILKLIFRVILLVLVLLLVRFISTGGVDKFFDMLTGSNQSSSQIIIKGRE